MIISYHIISYYCFIISNQIKPYQIISVSHHYHIIVLSYPFLSYPIFPNSSYHIISYHIVSYQIIVLSSHIISLSYHYQIISNHYHIIIISYHSLTSFHFIFKNMTPPRNLCGMLPSRSSRPRQPLWIPDKRTPARKVCMRQRKKNTWKRMKRLRPKDDRPGEFQLWILLHNSFILDSWLDGVPKSYICRPHWPTCWPSSSELCMRGVATAWLAHSSFGKPTGDHWSQNGTALHETFFLIAQFRIWHDSLWILKDSARFGIISVLRNNWTDLIWWIPSPAVAFAKKWWDTQLH